MQQRFPAFITFLVSDLNGKAFCDTNSDHRPVSIAARAYFANILKTGAFTVGEFSSGLSTGRNVLQFALPFYGDDGRMGGVIVAGLDLDWLADYIARKGVPEGAALAITDRNGTYLARYLSLSQIRTCWQLTENRAMLVPDAGFVSTDLWDCQRPVAVAGCA